MKSCGEYEVLISAFLDGELSEAERAETAEHLASCPACQRYFDDLVAIHDALDQGEVPAPEGFAGAVMDRVRATPQEKREKKTILFPGWKRWAATAACCGLAALGLWAFQARGGNVKGAGPSVRMAQDAPAAASMPAGAAEEDGACGESGDPLPEVEDAAEAAPEQKREALYSFGGGDDGGETEKAVLDLARDADEYANDLEPVPEEPLLAPACLEDQDSGVITAGGEAARAWVEDRLGLEWESGRTYRLTEEEFAALLEVLTEAEEDFLREAGEGWQLRAE